MTTLLESVLRNHQSAARVGNQWERALDTRKSHVASTMAAMFVGFVYQVPNWVYLVLQVHICFVPCILSDLEMWFRLECKMVRITWVFSQKYNVCTMSKKISES